MAQLELTRWNSETRENDVVGTVSTYDLARCVTPEGMAELLDDYVNAGFKDYRVGVETGKKLQCHHRTLQASIVRWALGVIIGLSDIDLKYTDARNETAVQCGKEIKRQLDEGTLNMGYMI